MARQNRTKTIDIILKHEGGFVDNPKDPGGATNFGVTQTTYDDWLARADGVDNFRSVREITMDEVHIIYGEYLDDVLFDELPTGIDMVVADTAIHSGPKQATRILQKAINRVYASWRKSLMINKGHYPNINFEVEVDGFVGIETTLALEKIENRVELVPELIAACVEEREKFLKSLSHFETFGRGWMKRTNNLRRNALNLQAKHKAAVLRDREAVCRIERPSLWRRIVNKWKGE